MDKLELYYDHYKESCALNREAQKRRNKNFVLLCCLEAISFWVLVSPESAFSSLASGISAAAGTILQLGNGLMQTLIWVLIIFVLIRYCQDTLYVERQYKYIEKIEKEITNCIDKSPFDREGDSYLEDYPMVLNFADLFYKMLAPITFFVINIIRIAEEWYSLDRVTLGFICDSIMFFAICIILWFYFFEIHSKITAWCKARLPLVNKIAMGLRKLLKEV